MFIPMTPWIIRRGSDCHMATLIRSDRRLTLKEGLFAGSLLALFYGAILWSLAYKSPTFDEPGHVSAGYSYWARNDYRLDPENGNLAKRWFAIPHILSGVDYPAESSKWWRETDDRFLADEWFYRSGIDPDRVTRMGRAMAALIAVAGAFLVWLWSRALFGPIGALFSLLLFVTFPGHLANGGLMTSDMAVSVLLLAATGAWWRLLGTITPVNLLLAGLATGALFLSKMSALVLIPTLGVLVVLKCLDIHPIRMGARWRLSSPAAKGAGILGASVIVAAITVILIWASFGFRYRAIHPKDEAGQFYRPWEWALGYDEPISLLQGLGLSPQQEHETVQVLSRHGALARSWGRTSSAALEDVKKSVLTSGQRLKLEERLARPPGFPQRPIKLACDLRLLPEAYLYGFANVFTSRGSRGAFLNGEVSKEGWLSFFPYLFLIKTPLVALAAFVFSLGLIPIRQADEANRQRWRGVIPLLTLIVVYGLVAIYSKTNIGHRHILPVYAPMFILCGAVAGWAFLKEGSRARAGRVFVYCVALLASVEAGLHFPNYLAYFNGIVRPRDAYAHVVDSSLDWGQELPATAAYVKANSQQGPFNVAYFGSASLYHYIPGAIDIFSYHGAERWVRPVIQAVPDCKPAGDDPKLSSFLTANSDYDGSLIFDYRGDDGRQGAALVKKPEALRLRAGTFLISASLTQPLFFKHVPGAGEWTQDHEKAFRALERDVEPLISDDPEVRRLGLPQRSFLGWQQTFEVYAEYRFLRLMLFLRERKPDDQINGAVLIYKLTSSDISQALEMSVRLAPAKKS